ncbi:sensor histidine kinase [Cohnella panacarvi]|uniref:sensor histidine kinase n=1 Tax=Cohnella panacarvi TaxID=400776 RepID=UPI00047EBB19|nr:HAMP domain-containing sensor histidine kinase [Cohnella panacarvi]
MKLRAKLAVTIGIVATLTAIAALLLGYAWGSHGDAGSRSLQYALILLFLFLLLGAAALWVAQLLASRMQQLVAEARQVSLTGIEKDIQVGGGDEIAELAVLFNRVSREWIQGEEARSRLVSDAAHELRTPVAILRGHLETMLKGAMEPKRENLVSLLDETKRMSRLIQELQQLSLAEAGKLRLDREWIDINLVLREVVDILSVEAEEKRIGLGELDALACEVYCDPSRMKQTLINLIGNAIRYTPEGGKVEIRQSAEADGFIRIEVADTGPGIAADKLPYIFHRFNRADDSRSRSAGGTGLGLAIAKQFVEAHGGTLNVASEIGSGTVFVLRLPVFPAA